MKIKIYDYHGTQAWIKIKKHRIAFLIKHNSETILNVNMSKTLTSTVCLIALVCIFIRIPWTLI